MNEPDKNSINEFEARLAALRPAEPEIDRDHLMYEAGWAAAEARLTDSPSGSPTVWKLATAASSLAAAALLVVVVNRPASPVAQASVNLTPAPSTLNANANDVEPPRQTPTRRRAGLAPAPAAPYLALRHAAITGRLDAFDRPTTRTSEASRPVRAPSTTRNLMEELLSDQGFAVNRT